MNKIKEQYAKESLEWLKTTISKEQDIYVVVTKVAQSGMSRRLKLFTVIDGKIFAITGYVA